MRSGASASVATTTSVQPPASPSRPRSRSSCRAIWRRTRGPVSSRSHARSARWTRCHVGRSTWVRTSSPEPPRVGEAGRGQAGTARGDGPAVWSRFSAWTASSERTAAGASGAQAPSSSWARNRQRAIARSSSMVSRVSPRRHGRCGTSAATGSCPPRGPRSTTSARCGHPFGVGHHRGEPAVGRRHRGQPAGRAVRVERVRRRRLTVVVDETGEARPSPRPPGPRSPRNPRRARPRSGGGAGHAGDEQGRGIERLDDGEPRIVLLGPVQLNVAAPRRRHEVGERGEHLAPVADAEAEGAVPVEEVVERVGEARVEGAPSRAQPSPAPRVSP